MLVKFNYVVVSLLIAAFSFGALAQEKKKTAEKPAAEVKAEASAEKKEDEQDQVITNRRLRADLGSNSNWSVRTFWNYSGGSVEKPGAAQRPNIVAGADALTLQNLSGDIGIRYRITKFDSLNLSGGVNMTTPFHSSIKTNDPGLKKNFNDNKQKATANDPSLRYSHVGSVLGIQSITSWSSTWITNAQLSDAGYETSHVPSQTFMKDFGNGLSAGVAFQAVLYTFQKQNDALADQVLGVYPAAEYVINDTYNLRTVFGQWVYQKTRGDDANTYVKRKVYQSVGLGISVTRDVFLYPNIQFIPSDVRDDRTNIAISANINLF
ncbi:MAG: hypothetical protein ACLGG0_03260 [Bacteriovoracia bacterium]